MTSSKKEIITNIYLYLVTFIGLLMIVIPSVDLLKIGLQTWIFPLASEDEYGYDRKPPEPYMIKGETTPIDNTKVEKIELNKSDLEAFNQWKVDYANWQKNQENLDVVTIRAQKDLVRDISTLVVGLALFLTHGLAIRKKKDV